MRATGLHLWFVVQASRLHLPAATADEQPLYLGLDTAFMDFNDPRLLPFVEPRSRGELPHLYKDGGSYFITFRLWDAVRARAGGTPAPQAPQREAGGWGCGAGVPPAPSPLGPDEIAARTEPPLRLGSCLLLDPAAASLVQSALLFFHGHRYDLAAWCVMPNHVHAVMTQFPGHSPSDVLHSWKSFTSHRLNQLLHRSGTIWERESFDHLIRSVEDFERFVAYVENNPVAAGLCPRPEDWPWCSARLRSH